MPALFLDGQGEVPKLPEEQDPRLEVPLEFHCTPSWSFI
jgi:hypothetical protein